MANISSRYWLGFCDLAHTSSKVVMVDIYLPGTSVKVHKVPASQWQRFCISLCLTWKCTFAKVSVDICKQMDFVTSVARIFKIYISWGQKERGEAIGRYASLVICQVIAHNTQYDDW